MSALEPIVPAGAGGGSSSDHDTNEHDRTDDGNSRTSSNNDSSSDSNGTDSEEEEEEEAALSHNLPPMAQLNLPEPRKHAYLPGASHPLYPEGWIGNTYQGVDHGISSPAGSSSRRLNRNVITSMSLSNDDDNSNSYDPIPPTVPSPKSIITELPILELDDVILFPGCTVPLRLRHPGWVEYLGSRIDEARLGTGGVTRDEVRIGVLMKMKETRRRRSNRVRPRRPHPPTVGGQGDGTGGETAAAAAAGAAGTRGGRRGRWRTELLRRGIRRAREPSQEETANEPGDDGGAETSDTPRAGDEFADGEVGGGGGGGIGRPSPPRPAVAAPPPDPLAGRIGCVAIITFTHEVAADDNGTNGAGDDQASPGAPSYQSRVWLRHSGQLIMTALGTSRFRILSRIDSSTWDAENRAFPELHRGDMADIKLYAVEILVDENLPLPPTSIRRGIPRSANIVKDEDSEMEDAAEAQDDKTEESEAICHDIVQTLSQCTPLPAYAYNMAWPWRLVQQICTELSEIPAWEGLRKSLPPSSGIVQDSGISYFHSNLADPLAFSFWMASNMPLPAYDRLYLLEMYCTVQRLRYILTKVAQQRQLDKPIRCKQCGETLATVSDMFTVGGAEGTTGAYVNEYGIVHQTITVRKCSSRKVFCVGNRETKDSWFPGYTWTIMHCALCHQHLGWKFDLLRQFRGSQQQQQSTDISDRPKRFFGLTGGAVTTEESHAPRRMNVADRLAMEARRQWFVALMQQRVQDIDNDGDGDGGEDDQGGVLVVGEQEDDDSDHDDDT